MDPQIRNRIHQDVSQSIKGKIQSDRGIESMKCDFDKHKNGEKCPRSFNPRRVYSDRPHQEKLKETGNL